MNLIDTIERNAAYIRTKIQMSVILCKTDRNGLAWECVLSRAPARVAPVFEEYAKNTDIDRDFIRQICREWEADVAYDGSNLIKFRVYAPKEYVI